MKKYTTALFIFIITAINSSACLNYYYTLDAEGHFHRQDGGLWHFDKNFNQEKIVNNLFRLEKKLKKEHAYTLLSDYAVGLMKLGKAKEAKDILAVLYTNYPNEYKLASNLGTAYELVGENDSALKYIKRGLQLNPNDHEGSEWVHVKILETKIQLKNNPNYLNEYSVLNLTDKQLKDADVRNQIEIQARERFPFSPGPDPIMASLMIDLGDAYAQSHSIEYAKAFYEMAKEYFGNKSVQLIQKIEQMKKLQNKYADKQPTDNESRKELPQLREEGDHSKLGGVSYKYLLDNNDYNYEVKWDKINSNPDSLLALVDLKRPADQIKTEAEKNTSDSLKFVKDEIKTGEQENESWCGVIAERFKNEGVYLYIGIAILLAVIFFFILKQRKN